jgi:Protein of unknown function (DUF1638).
MKEVFIICKMMEAEARAALASTGSAAEVIWMEKGLHARPDHLREAMQETIDRAEREFAPDRILLGYGFCGNALAGLRAHECVLVLPRIDDCITLFIGSRERKAELEGGVGTMFQTSDWSDTDGSVLSQKSRLYEDYDEDEAEELFQMMFGHYGRIGVLDTHCYDLEPVLRSSRAMAEALGFEHRVYDASNQFLVDLLSGGPFDEARFIVKEPGDPISLRDLRID